MRMLACLVASAVCLATPAGAQSSHSITPEQQMAQVHYREGWQHLAAEEYQQAAKEFQQAIDLDQKFTLAYYGLGRATMGLKQFSDAVKAYERSRDLYQAQSHNNFANRMEANAMRDQDIAGLQMAIQQLSPRSGNNLQVQNQIQQLRSQMQRVQMKRDNGMDLSISSPVPAFVSLALGSAYFRSERLADAEREYKTAVEMDPKAGEAHNNLAVVYFMTNRIQDADREVKAAEKVGYHVNPNLKDDIKKKKIDR
jgi:tetratricopeptide (TPR) repeat protein